MITVSLVSILAGAALGQRFKVWVLIPAIPILLVLVVRMGATDAQPAWSIALTAALAAMCVQIGYVAGILVRHVLVTALPRRSSPPTSSDTPARHAAL